MNSARMIRMAALCCALGVSASLYAGAPPAKKDAASPIVHITDADAMRVQGEQRFRANCRRCHAAPQKFPPRMMATVLRHMRVRATITDEDMRLVLFYMTQ
jgi:cytochrome c5